MQFGTPYSKSIPIVLWLWNLSSVSKGSFFLEGVHLSPSPMDFTTQAAILAVSFVICVLFTFVFGACLWDLFPACPGCPRFSCECETCNVYCKWCRIRCCPRFFSVDLKKTLMDNIEQQVRNTHKRTLETRRSLDEAKKRLENAKVMHEPTEMIQREVDVLEERYQREVSETRELIDELPMDQRSKWKL